MNKIAEFVIIIASMIGIIAGIIEFGQIGNLESIANLVNVFSGLGWFLGAFIVASLFTAYLVVIAPIKFFLRLLAIPAWLVFSVSLLVTVDQFMGYSYPAIPPQSTVIAYYVFKGPENQRMIEAWMYLRDEGRARAYNFPHTPEREQALEEGRKGAAKGEPVEVDLSEGRGSGEDSLGPMVIYNWDFEPTHPGKVEDPDDAPTTMPGDDGNTYKMNEGGEIEIVDPLAPAEKKNDWDDLSHPSGTENFDESYYGYGLE